MKKLSLLTISVIVFNSATNAQCLSAPVFPACLGTETLVVSNDNIGISQTKYFYGAATTLSNVKLSGGTLVVCSDLTLSDFTFDSGTLFIQPTATLVVNNGAGLVVKGNTSIYNAGSFECQGNYVMDGSYASAVKPNIFINTSSTSWLKMSNQYFVINNPYSKFINNGTADFHGLITDPQAATGSVCLGNNSKTTMTVLYNKAKYPYIAPEGSACVSVSQYSQFYDTLTIYPNINFCLASTHTSDATCIPWGCKPNAWGGGQVTNNCSNCSMVLTALPINIKKIAAKAYANYNQISWQTGDTQALIFYVQRSTDGSNFTTFDSIEGGSKILYTLNDYHFTNNSFYRISYYKNNQKLNSDVAEVRRAEILEEVYPNPFKTYLVIHLNTKSPTSFNITDVDGRKINSYKTFTSANKITFYFENITKGMYLVTINNGKECRTYKMIKE